MQPPAIWSLATALTLLVTVAAGVGAWARLGQTQAVLTASIRALVQLVLVGAVIGLIFRTPVLAPIYVALMLSAAAWTSGRRFGQIPHAIPIAALGILAGAATSAFVVLISHALPFDTRTAVPFVAQLIGGSMTAASLAGQRLLDDVSDSWPEVEGWLALGATPAQATIAPARRAAARALVPALDQTRNVGLVVHPGAFVGLLLGGATVLEAGRVQLLVLVGLLAAETIAAVTVTRLLALRLSTAPARR